MKDRLFRLVHGFRGSLAGFSFAVFVAVLFGVVDADAMKPYQDAANDVRQALAPIEYCLKQPRKKKPRK